MTLPSIRTIRRSTPFSRWGAAGALALTLTACGGGGTTATSADIADISDTGASAQAAVTATVPPPPAAAALSPLAQLGQQLFNDPNLSQPPGTACVACHQPASGYADGHGSSTGVALGSTPAAVGLRAPLQNAYSAGIPAFGFVADASGRSHPRGGQFWDGRADTLAAQALLPLLNSAEMNNPSAAVVVAKVAAAPYAAAFVQQFGAASLSNTASAFAQIGLAIQAFEQAAPLQAFSSKFDAVLAGKAAFSAAEQRGLGLFTNPNSANCASCHAMNPKSARPSDSLFSDFSYHADGVPRNPALPQNRVATFFDLGLCGPARTVPAVPAGVTADSLCGKFRVPSLRNVARRQHFMHNAFFTNLNDVVSFYATRASDPQRWYGPSGIPNDLPARYLQNLETHQPPFNGSPSSGAVLTPAQVSDLVAFLGTLSDGFLAGPPAPAK